MKKRATRAVVLHGAVPPDAPLDEQDSLEEAAGVGASLEALGFEVSTVALTLDLAAAARKLKRLAPRFVFNLVESVEGRGSLIHLAPALLEHLGIPYTGAPLEGLFLTSNKVLAKEVMETGNLPTPRWLRGEEALRKPEAVGFPCIVKSAWEHASIGVSEDGVAGDAAALREILTRRAAERDLYVEAFVEGREFNLALLGGEVLDPSEILFEDYPEGKLRIIDYTAKWDENSFEYEHTPRTFDFPEADRPLLKNMRAIGLESWRVFKLRGSARLDLRVDQQGRPWIMEINANPCINPEGSGFVATAERAGCDYTGLVKRIVLDTFPAGLPLD